jgi:hypothetical protein
MLSGEDRDRSNPKRRKREKKRRQLLIIEGIKAPAFFHKDEKKRTLAILASSITEDQRQGRKKGVTSYEIGAQGGQLGTLQKFLDADDCETTTDGKLLMRTN